MGEAVVYVKMLKPLLEVINSEGGMVAFLSLCLMSSWTYLIRKFNHSFEEVKEDQAKCHKDREQLKKELEETQRINKELEIVNEQAQQRLTESQAVIKQNNAMLQNAFEKLMAKLEKK